MKASIWLYNLEGKLFEVTNTANDFLELAEKHSNLSCNKYDLILFHTAPTRMFQKNWEIVHRSKDAEEAKLIKDTVQKLLYVKAQKLRQRQALKKMKNPHAVGQLITQIDSDLRHYYFEVTIEDILNGNLKELLLM